MSNFKLSTESERRLQGVHPELVKVVRLALTKSPVDFRVLEGVRTMARQKELLAKGATKTLKSRHLTGHAVDLLPLPVDWNNKKPFKQVADAMFAAAKEFNVHLRWGGDWNMNGYSNDERFYDGPHFELQRGWYP